jgi:hypothetical protein
MFEREIGKGTLKETLAAIQAIESLAISDPRLMPHFTQSPRFDQ